MGYYLCMFSGFCGVVSYVALLCPQCWHMNLKICRSLINTYSACVVIRNLLFLFLNTKNSNQVKCGIDSWEFLCVHLLCNSLWIISVTEHGSHYTLKIIKLSKIILYYWFSQFNLDHRLLRPNINNGVNNRLLC